MKRWSMPLDATGAALRRLVADGSDLDQPMKTDFMVAVPDEAAGHHVAEGAQRLGYETSVEQDEDADAWTCYCTKTLVPSYQAVASAEAEIDALGRAVGGWCDGFGSFGNAPDDAERFPIDDDPAGFWRWFAAVADQIGWDLQSDALLQELDQRVGCLGFGWEIGEGVNEPRMLALSPGGDRALLVETTRVVAMAPRVPGWELYPAKPPTGSSALLLEMHDDDGNLVEADASGWRFRLEDRRDDTVTLIVEAGGLRIRGEDERIEAVQIVLDSLLGEQVRLSWIASVVVTGRIAGDHARPLPDLPTHVPPRYRSS